jgi:hypothetical protein
MTMAQSTHSGRQPGVALAKKLSIAVIQGVKTAVNLGQADALCNPFDNATFHRARSAMAYPDGQGLAWDGQLR